MTPFIANTDSDRKLMLDALGLGSVAELFAAIPEKYRFPDLKLPAALSEPEIFQELSAAASRNADAGGYALFAGAGAYNHFVPSVVDALSSRGEFFTAYTPYQPEASQGTLQALFEYQSMAADLFGMDIVNASHYDGASALAEALLMAWNAASRQRSKVVLSSGLHPEYRAVIETYTRNLGITLCTPGPGTSAGAKTETETETKMETETLESLIDAETACVAVQFPSFFGNLEDYSRLCETAHRNGALFIVSADPLSLALFEPPGSYGADIVTGEGQPLGNYLSFGGPCLGMFAATKSLVRKMPGRLAGEAMDGQGRRGYVLTLSTREQHIRREKAVSNICTNQGLAALRAAIYLAVMGKNGLKKVADITYRRARYAAGKLGKLPGFSVLNTAPFFREFVLRCPLDTWEIMNRCAKLKIVPGVPLSRWFPERTQDILVCVTEMNSRSQIDSLVSVFETFCGEAASEK
ncbi:MAG: aminomethyl-transferring glycine dehydrogenase subunit GcvPA [Spirochaetales bacterium]|jgi:glycine dehydrogenase subunit 1|nr:aminomethyl-transferring glycine dehydrogenase subunit GcvPA [Spirochaetales bacterium]